MQSNRLLNLATNFEKMAQDYDFNVRNQLVNIPPNGTKFSFRDVANVVLQDLTSLDREEKDLEITNANHALLNILNDVSVPNVNEMLNAANQALNVLKQKVPRDADKIKVANYLVQIVQLLMNKSSTTGTDTISNENSATFLQRLYHTLRQNQPLSSEDQSKWENNKGLYLKRLQGLNSLPNLTPQQEQEKNILQFVTARV